MKRRSLIPALGLAAMLALPATAQTSEAAKLVPAEVKARGTLRVGSQQTFPPVEFREPGKTEAVGVSADLLAEVARRLGLKLEYIQGEYASLISGVEAEGVLIALDLAGVAASSGSACTSGAQRPSHVLEALGIPARDAVGGLRLTLGHSNTPEDVAYVLEKLPQIVAQIKGAAPVML